MLCSPCRACLATFLARSVRHSMLCTAHMLQVPHLQTASQPCIKHTRCCSCDCKAQFACKQCRLHVSLHMHLLCHLHTSEMDLSVPLSPLAPHGLVSQGMSAQVASHASPCLSCLRKANALFRRITPHVLQFIMCLIIAIRPFPPCTTRPNISTAADLPCFLLNFLRKVLQSTFVA